MSPFDHGINHLVENLRSLNLIQVLFNMPPGDWAAGDRGPWKSADRVGEFRTTVQSAIDATNILNSPTVNCLSGIPGHGSEPTLPKQTLVDKLRDAAAEFAKHGSYHMQVMDGSKPIRFPLICTSPDMCSLPTIQDGIGRVQARSIDRNSSMPLRSKYLSNL